MPLIRQLDVLLSRDLKQFLQEDHLFLQTLSPFPGHDQCRALPLSSAFRVEDRKDRNADPDLCSVPAI